MRAPIPRGPLLAVLLPVMFLACFAGSCDHTVLSGRIQGSDVFEVGRATPLALEVPEDLSGIYRETWSVEPDGAGRFEGGDEGRSVVFVPLTPGRAVLRVQGFYRQTNPQPVTDREILIRPAP